MARGIWAGKRKESPTRWKKTNFKIRKNLGMSSSKPLERRGKESTRDAPQTCSKKDRRKRIVIEKIGRTFGKQRKKKTGLCQSEQKSPRKKKKKKL